MQRLKVSSSKRYLSLNNGDDFFWLGDTAWEMLHKLSVQEIEFYFKIRSQQEFNVTMLVALAEDDGLLTPNHYGRIPFSNIFDLTPDTSGKYSYWEHLDFIIETAEKYGMYVALLPSWGDKFLMLWGKGPEVLNEKNSLSYGKWLGERYKKYNNLIWVLGGDRPLNTTKHFEIINNIASGIKSAGAMQLMTFHPCGNCSSSKFLHNAKWLDFNMIQSGHCALNFENYIFIENDYKLKPIKPVLEAEPRYEDHPINFKSENGYFDDADVRQAAYWAVFSGSLGITYGNHSVWSFNDKSTDYFPLVWEKAIFSMGANQMKYLKQLFSKEKLDFLIPSNEMLTVNYAGANKQCAISGEYTYIYSPNGLTIKTVSKLTSPYWYSPITGESIICNDEKNEYYPPTAGRGRDWVLIGKME